MSYSSKQMSNKKTQQLKLPFINLEKEGLILESRNIPEKRYAVEHEIPSFFVVDL